MQQKQDVQQQTAQWLEQHHLDQKASRFDTLETRLFPSDPELEPVSDSLRRELEKARQQDEVVGHRSQKQNNKKKTVLMTSPHCLCPFP